MNQSLHNGKVCYYCRRVFNEGVKRTKDHVVPSSKGGLNVKDNVIPACEDCNQWKSDKSLEYWLREVQRNLYKRKHPISRRLTNTHLGQIIGNVRKLMTDIKNRQDISIYMPK